MKVTKKLLSLWLALVMVVSLLPTTVLATEAELYDGIETVETLSDEAVLPDESDVTDDAEAVEDAAEPAEQAEEQEIAAPVEEIALAQEMPTLDAAGDEAVVVIACSDFQHPDGDAKGQAFVQSVLSQMKNDGITPANGFICCGDYSYGYSYNTTTLSDHLYALKNTVETAYPSNLDEVFVQGNHDQVRTGTGGLSSSGENDTEDYGVFVINEDDYMWASDASNSSTTYSGMSAEEIVQQTANNLKRYLNDKLAEPYSKPIFVVSHLPLHYSMRTNKNGDGMYANYIFDVLNEAGENGLNIIFLYGHDHSHGWDNYLGGAAVYLAKGNSINIAQGSKTTFATKTLNFTYMNAGFTGYYEAYGADNTLTMTAFKITDDKVTVSRYSADSVYNLKSAGAWNGEYNDSKLGYEQNTTVVPSPQDIVLNTFAVDENTTLTDDATGVSVTTTAGTTLNVSKVTNVNQDWLNAANIAKYYAYDITIPGFSNSEDKATVSLPVGDLDPERTCVFYVGAEGLDIIDDARVENGMATFTTNHFSTYAVGEIGEVEIDDGAWVRIEGSTSYVYTQHSGTIESGERYLIVAPSAAYALKRDGDTGTDREGVTISNGTITLNTNDYDWTITNETTYNYRSSTITPSFSNNRYTLSNPGDYYYLVNGEYKQVTSATCTREEHWRLMGGRYYTYSWTINYDGVSATSTNQRITLYTKSATASGYTIQQAGQYLRGGTSIGTGTTANMWTITTRTDGRYRLNNGSTNLVYYSNGFTYDYTTNASYAELRLFRLTNTTTTPSTYVAMSGPNAYTFTVNQFASDAAVKEYLKQNIKVWEASSNTGTGMHEVDYDITGTVTPGTAGTYNLTVTYNGQEWPITVKVVNRTVTSISVAPMTGEVYVNAAGTAKTGSKLTVTYSDGGTETIDVTLSMLSGNGLDTTTVGECPGLTVTYGGKSVSGYTLNVLSRAGNDYPEYPNEGSVRVNKVGEGIDFQSTGVAKIELSATGVPMTKGVDVVIMLDTSSSMKDNVDGTTRIAVLRQSLSNMLASFNEVDATTGKAPDIRIAVADFNGYTSSGPYALSSDDHLTDSTTRSGGDTAKVYTGTKTLDIGAFVPATEYDTAEKRSTFVGNIDTGSGTNYDAAFYKTYQLVDAVNKANAEAEENRDLYVIFMSDGAPFQYNGFSSQSENASRWNNWLQGTGNYAASGSHSYFYNTDNNKHWWAEAIKGDPDTPYTVIDKTKNTTGSNAYMTEVNGLGAKMYSIGFCLAKDKSITVASMENVLRKIATDETYYHKADTAADLDTAFSQIATNIKKAGKDAVFTDVMGANYDLRLANYNTKADGSGESKPTSITVSTYELYKKSEVGTTVGGKLVTADMVGTRKSDTPKTDQETVTFNADGTQAYSNKLGGNSNNILTNGKINAKLFTYDLATETFKWNIGDITEDEQVLSYYVYLTGSMEGERPAGSYPTNESAVLTYKNWLDHDAHKDTVSPVLPWKDANVSYAFYLVDSTGKPVVNRTTGETGSFTNRVAMSTPYVYKTLNLNSSADLRDMEVIANQVLPEGYSLYNPNASYTVTVISDGSGSNWVVSDTTGTTYVTDYKGNEYTNQSHATADVDYTHTTVWFAVRYEIKAVPDVVVIDYGLPVDINVLANDMFGENGTLRAVGMAGNKPDGKTSALDSHFATELTATYGTAKVSGDKVRYTPANMQMSAPDKLAYAVNYQNSNAPDNNGYYYSDVTVIPATTIYYEDSFVSFNNDAKGTDASGKWSQVGETMPGVQAEDRPGLGNLKGTDANNLYGFDEAYENCTTFSLGSAKKVTVSKANNPNTKYSGEEGHNWPTAEFTFTGTGFDLISVTSKMTGMIGVEVYRGDTLYKDWAVDTFYGYSFVQDSQNPYIKYTWSYGTDGKWHSIEGLPVATAYKSDPVPADPVPVGKTFVTYEKNGSWQVTPNADNALYQIPVIKGSGFDYGTYRVVITPTFSSTFDNAGRNEYDFYLDAVRIYDPAGDNAEANDAYVKDNEAYPRFIELRNNLIATGNFGTVDDASGAVFIDGFGATGSISDYSTYGPNNEVYLAPNQGQAVAFTLSKANADVATVQIGVKALSGEASVEIKAIDGASKKITTNSATDLYYDITDVAAFDQSGNTKVIVITNSGNSLVSITNIKTTYKAAPAAPVTLRMSASAAKMAVQSVNAMYLSSLPVAEVEEVVEPQVFAPDKCTVSLSKANAKVGDSITVTVKTSADVASVTVNGNNAKAGKTDRKTGEKTWTYTVKATEAGQLLVSVTAYDKAGLASEAIDNTITVNAKGTNIIGTAISRVLGWFRR